MAKAKKKTLYYLVLEEEVNPEYPAKAFYKFPGYYTAKKKFYYVCNENFTEEEQLEKCKENDFSDAKTITIHNYTGKFKKTKEGWSTMHKYSNKNTFSTQFNVQEQK